LQPTDWYVSNWDPAAEFTITPVNATDFLLTNNSVNADLFSFSIDGINWIELTETATSIAINEPGDYEISLIAQRCGLSDTATQIIQVSTNSVVPQNKMDFTIYPNPAKDMVTIEIPKTLTCNGIQVLNMLGEIVYRLDATFTEAFTMDCRSLTSGIYTVQAFTNRGIVSKQLKVH